MFKINDEMINIVPYCEIQEVSLNKISGKAKIKMSALKISETDNEYQGNGLTWIKDYVLNNIDTAKHMHYVVSWLDEENQIPKNHGNQEINEFGEIVFKDSVVVGDVRDAYFETIEVNGIKSEVLMTEGFINTQRYNKFYHWLKQETKKGTVYGSVELRGKQEGKISYENNECLDKNGSPLMGRKPKIFDFTDLAILYITTPADVGSQVLEINNKEVLDNKEDKVLEKELNEKLINLNSDLMKKDLDINNLNIEVNNLKADLEIKKQTIDTLTKEKDGLSNISVEINKKINELENSNSELTKELEELKKFKLDKELEEGKALVNSYFEDEITKNGFSESELRDLKKYVETNDLNGLKDAEKELVLAKFKENIKKPDTEINQSMMRTTHKKKSNFDDDFSL